MGFSRRHSPVILTEHDAYWKAFLSACWQQLINPDLVVDIREDL